MNDKTLSFTRRSLAEALDNVRCLSGLGPELIAEQVFAANALQPASAAPDGWKLVPVRATREQVNAVCMHPDLARALYRSMVEAAPAAAPVAQEPSEEAAYQIGAKGAEPTESERLLFEAWMRGHCWAVAGEWNGKTYIAADEDGRRVNQHAMLTRQLWAAWRDRAALTGNSAQPAAEQPIGDCASPVAEQPDSAMQALATISRMARNEACRSGVSAAGQLCTWDAIADMADAVTAEQPDTAKMRDLLKRYFDALDRFDREGPVSLVVAAAKEADALEKELRALLAGGEV